MIGNNKQAYKALIIFICMTIYEHRDSTTLEYSALEIVRKLEDVAKKRTRTYPSVIDVVFVPSGTGTYYDRLKPNEKERWERGLEIESVQVSL